MFRELFRRKPSPNNAPFSFTIEHEFYIKPPVDRVILVGTVGSGCVTVGDKLIVRCLSCDIPVTVEGIETPKGELREANRPQQVGLRLSGIAQDQVIIGDQVVSPD